MSESSIFALATPPGRSALAIIRVSGYNLADQIASFLPKGKLLQPNQSVYTTWSFNGLLVDDIILLYFQSPKSFTGEDIIEINCHGNPVIIEQISKSLLSKGFKPAKPGEFTRRAYQNNKMNRDQALAVQEIIEARAEQDLQSALRLREGSLSKLFYEFKESLLTLTADLTAELDFVDEGIEFADRESLQALVKEISAQLASIQDVTKTAEIYRHGLSVVIAGLPNAGKSSLLNLLCGHEKAIVSSTPGTTRDIVQYESVISGIPVTFSDTAGIRKASNDPIEVKGMQKGLSELENADLTILVIDSSEPPANFFEEVSDQLSSLVEKSSNLVLLNKWESKNAEWETTDIYRYSKQVSLIQGESSTEVFTWLQEQIKTLVPANGIQANYWQKGLITELHRIINDAVQYLSNDEIEIAVQLLTDALEILSELVGEIDNEEILDKLFSRFCVGK